jgi:NTE family protein
MPRIVSLLVIAFLLAGTVRAQPAPGSQSAAPSERPTIALVLSGGAAKGLAHIGVIQVFEEEGIPFDIIAGTSAGALIGSFYAVGYTGRQIEDIVRSAGPDLNDLFFDRIDATMLRIEETRIPDETLVSLPIDQFRPRLPEGVVAGQRVIQLVSKYTWGYHHIEDFSQLPRPYVCNAVDLVSGRDIALTRGFLPEAARACISLPGFFEPFEQDSLLLVGGGTSHNLPVPEAKAIGGEVLVGVDVGDDIGPDGEVQLNATGNEGSLLFNLMKNLTFNRRSVLLEHRSQLALVVDPDVSGVDVFDFNTASVFIERGRQAARAMIPEIRALLDELGSPQPRRAIEPPSLAPVRVDRVDLHGVTGPAAALVRDLLGFDLTIPGMVGPDDMDRAISRIYATELFETVVYKLIPEEGGGPATIQVEVTPLDEPDNVAVGFRYDDLYAASLLVTLELRNKLRYGSTTGLIFRLGRQLRIGAEYFTRLGRQSV